MIKFGGKVNSEVGIRCFMRRGGHVLPCKEGL